MKVNRKIVLMVVLLFLFSAMSVTQLMTPVRAEEEVVGARIGTARYSYLLSETVTISGWAFNPQTGITMTVLRSDNRTDSWSDVTSDANGEFVTYYKLDGVAGIYKVTATDGTNTADDTFASSAWVIWTDKANYEPNETVTIFGSGFDPHAGINITVLRPDNSSDAWSLNADAYGNFTTTYKLDGVLGEYQVTATDGIKEAATRFTDAYIVLSPTSGPVGTTVTVTGYGFYGFGTSARVYFDGREVARVYPYAGYFSTSFQVPVGSWLGWHYVYADNWYYFDYASFLVTPPQQYVLTLVTNPPDITTPTGSGSYSPGTYASISTAQFVDIVPGASRYRFNSWSGEGITDPASTSTTVLMDKDKTVTANYVIQYLVTFGQTGLDDSAVGTVVTVDGSEKTSGDLPFTMWVDSGTSVSYSYEATVSSSVSGKRFRLDDVTGPTSPITVTGPTTVTGNYIEQYFLSVQTDPVGITTIPGEGWYDINTVVNLEAPTEVAGPPGVRYIFDHWTVDGNVISGNPISVHMDADHTATAHYITQYYLTVTSPYDTPGGEGWYNEGDEAYALLDYGFEPPNIGFVGWSGDASGWELTSNPIKMNGPKTAVALWEASQTYGDVRTTGFWRHQFTVWYRSTLGIKGTGTAQVSVPELEDYLTLIWTNSEYFKAKYPTGITLMDAYQLLAPLKAHTMQQAAEQQLFAVWLNLARRAFFWNTQLSQSTEYIYATYGLEDIGQAILFCEAELLKPDENYEAAKNICDSINNNLGIIWGT